MNNRVKSFTISPSNSSGLNEIPMILNGRVEYSVNQNSSKSKIKFLKFKPTKKNKYAHKIHIIGDSHFKDIAIKLKQYLGTQYLVSSFIKPGANVKQIVETQEQEFECLNRNDFIVINDGSNNLAKNSSEDNSVLSCLEHFVQKYSNPNVLILNIPIRYDPLTNFQINQDIMNFNDKLQKSTRPCNHVHLVEMSTDRKYFTNHGFHLNKPGKERIGRQIADQIREIVNSVSKKEHTYLSHLKDDHSSGVMRIDDTQSFWSTSCEGNASHLGNRPFQENHTQQDRSILDHIIRMDNDHGKVVMSTKEEMVISNSGSGKVEEVNSELISASAIEQRTLNAKKVRGESTQVEDNIDEIMGLCITYSESKNVNEGKHVRVSKSTYDLHSVASTEEDSCVIRERVFENRVFDKGQEVRSELENGSELELRTAKD